LHKVRINGISTSGNILVRKVGDIGVGHDAKDYY
jgi:hypothetical protein